MKKELVIMFIIYNCIPEKWSRIKLVQRLHSIITYVAFQSSLKLKTIHKCFLCPYKRQSSMLCLIAFRFSRVTEIMVQVKRAIGKAILHKLPIYNEYMCLCWVSTLFCMICCLFINCSKSSTTRLRSLYISFYLCCKSATFLCGRTSRNAMKRSIEICLL